MGSIVWGEDEPSRAASSRFLACAWCTQFTGPSLHGYTKSLAQHVADGVHVAQSSWHAWRTHADRDPPGSSQAAAAAAAAPQSPNLMAAAASPGPHFTATAVLQGSDLIAPAACQEQHVRAAAAPWGPQLIADAASQEQHLAAAAASQQLQLIADAASREQLAAAAASQRAHHIAAAASRVPRAPSAPVAEEQMAHILGSLQQPADSSARLTALQEANRLRGRGSSQTAVGLRRRHLQVFPLLSPLLLSVSPSPFHSLPLTLSHCPAVSSTLLLPLFVHLSLPFSLCLIS